MIYLIAGLLILLIVLVFTGNKSVHSEITINASTEKVWGVITDMKQYPEWNPVMELLNGEVKEGNKVLYRFTQDETTSSEIGATVLKVIPNKLLNQKGGIPLVLTFDHQYLLERSGVSTKVIIHEKYTGIGVNFWNPKAVEEAYQRLNEALKRRTESI